MAGRAEDAFYFLRNGEFEKAKTIFSRLLDDVPDHLDWREGFFLSSYWDNKLDHLLSLREGKDRGSALLRYLQDFENEMEKRGFPKSEAYQASVSCILEETSHHLGIAFRLEGWNGLDKASLEGLAVCHIRLNHFAKALEVLDYGITERFNQTELQFLRAECMIGLGKWEDGKDLYIRGFIEDPYKLSIGVVHWQDLLHSLEEAKTISQGEGNEILLLPILMWKRGLLENTKIYRFQDLLQWTDVLKRMSSALDSHQERFKLKTMLRCYFIATVVLSKFSERNHPDQVGFAKSILSQTRKEISGLLPV